MSITEPSKISRQLYYNVKLLAKAKGLKMMEVEKAAGLAIGYFSRCNQCRNSTSIDTVYALAKLFNVSIDDLISDTFEKRMKIAVAKTTIADAISIASEIFTKEEIIRIIMEDK